MKTKEKVLSVLWSFALALFAVSASIAVPILWRGFYYLHIDALHLQEATGWNRDIIREAYDRMMDYEWKNAPFGTGALKWSEEGMRHFEDVRKLFHLDAYVLVFSAIVLLFLVLIRRKARPYRFLNRAPSFYAGWGILVFFGIITALAARDFDKAFTTFHHLFFPGKTNWLFDYRTDEIILILPQVYFRNCAILAVALIALFCILYIILGRKGRSHAPAPETATPAAPVPHSPDPPSP